MVEYCFYLPKFWSARGEGYELHAWMIVTYLSSGLLEAKVTSCMPGCWVSNKKTKRLDR